MVSWALPFFLHPSTTTPSEGVLDRRSPSPCPANASAAQCDAADGRPSCRGGGVVVAATFVTARDQQHERRHRCSVVDSTANFGQQHGHGHCGEDGPAVSLGSSPQPADDEPPSVFAATTANHPPHPPTSSSHSNPPTNCSRNNTFFLHVDGHSRCAAPSRNNSPHHRLMVSVSAPHPNQHSGGGDEGSAPPPQSLPLPGLTQRAAGSDRCVLGSGSSAAVTRSARSLRVASGSSSSSSFFSERRVYISLGVLAVMFIVSIIANAALPTAAVFGIGDKLRLITKASAHAFNFSAMTVFSLTDDTMMQSVFPASIEAEAQRPWLLMIYSPQCEHCKYLMPVFDAAAATIASKAGAAGQKGYTLFGAVDGTANPRLVQRLGLTAFPLFLYAVNGHVRPYYGGTASSDAFVAAAQRLAVGVARRDMATDLSQYPMFERFLSLDATRKPLFVICREERALPSSSFASEATPTAFPHKGLVETLMLQEGAPRIATMVESDGPPLLDMPSTYDATSPDTPYARAYWGVRRVCAATRALAAREVQPPRAPYFGGGGRGATPMGTGAQWLGPTGEVLVVLRDLEEEPIPYLGPAWEVSATAADADAAQQEGGGGGWSPSLALALQPLLSAPHAPASFRTSPLLAMWVYEHSFGKVEPLTAEVLQAASARSRIGVLVTRRTVDPVADTKYYPIMRAVAKDRHQRSAMAARERAASGSSTSEVPEVAILAGHKVSFPTFSYGAGVLADLAARGAPQTGGVNVSGVSDWSQVAGLVGSEKALPMQLLVGSLESRPDWYEYVGVGDVVHKAGNLPLFFVNDPIAQRFWVLPLVPLRVKGGASGADQPQQKSKKKKSKKIDDEPSGKAGGEQRKRRRSPKVTAEEAVAQINAFIDAIERGELKGTSTLPSGRIAEGLVGLVPPLGLLLAIVGGEFVAFLMIVAAIPICVLFLAISVWAARRQAAEGIFDEESDADDDAAGGGSGKAKAKGGLPLAVRIGMACDNLIHLGAPSQQAGAGRRGGGGKEVAGSSPLARKDPTPVGHSATVGGAAGEERGSIADSFDDCDAEMNSNDGPTSPTSPVVVGGPRTSPPPPSQGGGTQRRRAFNNQSAGERSLVGKAGTSRPSPLAAVASPPSSSSLPSCAYPTPSTTCPLSSSSSSPTDGLSRAKKGTQRGGGDIDLPPSPPLLPQASPTTAMPPIQLATTGHMLQAANGGGRKNGSPAGGAKSSRKTKN